MAGLYRLMGVKPKMLRDRRRRRGPKVEVFGAGGVAGSFRRPGPAALLLVLALAVAACTRDTLNDPGEHGTATPPATTQTTHTPTPAPSTTTQPPVQATTTPPDAWPFGLGDAHCTEHEIERDQVSGVLRDGVGVFGWVTDPGLPKEGWVSVFEEIEIVWTVPGTGRVTFQAIGPDGVVIAPLDGAAPAPYNGTSVFTTR